MDLEGSPLQGPLLLLPFPIHPPKEEPTLFLSFYLQPTHISKAPLLLLFLSISLKPLKTVGFFVFFSFFSRYLEGGGGALVVGKNREEEEREEDFFFFSAYSQY